jgi:hypothetical protein
MKLLIKNKYSIIVLLFTILFIFLDQQKIKLLFETILGRAILILFFSTITYFNSLLGVGVVLIFLGLYNSKVFEGLENEIKNKNVEETLKPPSSSMSSTSEQINDLMKLVPMLTIPSSITPSESITNTTTKSLFSPSAPVDNKPNTKINTLDKSVNKKLPDKIDIQSAINPKNSKSIPELSTTNSSLNEPMSNVSGPEGFQSNYSLI